MSNIIHFSPNMSIKDDLLPFLNKHLHTAGWTLVRLQPSDKIETDLLLISALAGQMFGNNFGYHVLDANNAHEILAIHTEGISNEDGIIPYFALGYIRPST